MMWFFLLVFAGIFIWLANLHIVNLVRDWPVMLIVAGLLVFAGMVKRSRKNRILIDLEQGKINVEEAEDKLKRS